MLRAANLDWTVSKVPATGARVKKRNMVPPSMIDISSLARP
jgi:hypothetical protein